MDTLFIPFFHLPEPPQIPAKYPPFPKNAGALFFNPPAREVAKQLRGS